MQIEDELFEVKVTIYDEAGNIIGKGNHPATVGATSSFQKCTIKIDYIQDIISKANKVEIVFASTTEDALPIGDAKTVNAPNGDNDRIPFTIANAVYSDYNNVRVGSELRINNVELIYTED